MLTHKGGGGSRPLIRINKCVIKSKAVVLDIIRPCHWIRGDSHRTCFCIYKQETNANAMTKPRYRDAFLKFNYF